MISLPNPTVSPYTDFSSDNDMTTATFAEFCATADARNTIELNIRKYCLMLCDALEQNFKDRNHGKVGGYDAPVYKFVIETGVSITRSSWRCLTTIALLPALSTHLSTRRLVKSTSLLVSKRLLKVFVSTSC